MVDEEHQDEGLEGLQDMDAYIYIYIWISHLQIKWDNNWFLSFIMSLSMTIARTTTWKMKIRRLCEVPAHASILNGHHVSEAGPICH